MVFYKLGPVLDLFRTGLLLRDFSERHDGRRVTRRGCAETFESGVCVCTSKTSGRCEQVFLVLSECGLKWSTGFYWINIKGPTSLEGYLEGYQRTAPPRPEGELIPIATGLRRVGDLVKETL